MLHAHTTTLLKSLATIGKKRAGKLDSLSTAIGCKSEGRISLIGETSLLNFIQAIIEQINKN